MAFIELAPQSRPSYYDRDQRQAKMIKSLTRLNSVLEPDEKYLWHAAVMVGSPGLGRRTSVVFTAVAILVVIQLGTTLAPLVAQRVVDLLQLSDLQEVIAFLVLVPAAIGAAIMTVRRIARPTETIVVTDRRVIQISADMKNIQDFEYDEVGMSYREKTVTVRAERAGEMVIWACVATKDHAEHLAMQLGQKIEEKVPMVDYKQ